MISRVFCVRDTAVGAYMPPFFMPSKGAAIRAFSDCVNDAKHQFGKHSADYVLFELGAWDDSDGVFKTHACPVSLGVGVEFLNKSVEG